MSEKLRERLPRLRPPERPREPAAVRGRCRGAREDGARVLVISLRRRRVVPDAGGHCVGRSPPYGSRSSRPSTSPRRTGRNTASTSSPHATSRSTGRDSVRTWPSRAWSPPSQRANLRAPRRRHAVRSFTYVEDAVDATIGAMERASSGSTLNVGGGEGVDAAGNRGAGKDRRSPARDRPVASPRRRRDAHGRRHGGSCGDRVGVDDLVRGRSRRSMALGR